MPDLAETPPARRADLIIRPIGDAGRYVVKDPSRREYFELGGEEHFLLQQLDGQQSAESICTAFEEHFGGPLSQDDLAEFLALARERGFLQPGIPSPLVGEGLGGGKGQSPRPQPSPIEGEGVQLHPAPPRKRQSLLYWRKSLFDPDRLFTWLEPKIRFFWTRTFVLFSATCIVLAALVLWT
ncbi:MAG: PqqD family protein, partial [Pirellulales bacterium]